MHLVIATLVDIHFGVVFFGRLPAVGGSLRTRRRSATGKRCGGENGRQDGREIAGVWGRRGHSVRWSAFGGEIVTGKEDSLSVSYCTLAAIYWPIRAV